MIWLVVWTIHSFNHFERMILQWRAYVFRKVETTNQNKWYYIIVGALEDLQKQIAPKDLGSLRKGDVSRSNWKAFAWKILNVVFVSQLLPFGMRQTGILWWDIASVLWQENKKKKMMTELASKSWNAQRRLNISVVQPQGAARNSGGCFFLISWGLRVPASSSCRDGGLFGAIFGRSLALEMDEWCLFLKIKR